MKQVFLFLILINFTHLNCQITIVNHSNFPIAYVKLYSSNQTLLTQSDINGVIEWGKLKNLSPTDTIYFKHISYNTKWLKKKDINNIIVLTESNYNLSEILVTESKSKKHQFIDACFRSYQKNNDLLIYYTDGLIEYTTKTNKQKYKNKLKEYRTYQNSIYISDLKKRKFTNTFKVVRVPPPLVEYLPKKYFKHKRLSLSKKNDREFDILTKNNIVIGTIEKDSNYITYFINDVFSNKIRKFAKYEAIQLKSEITLIFKCKNQNGNFLITNFDDLVYSKIYRQYNFKYVTDVRYTKIDNIEEIFVESVKHLNEIEIDNYNNRFGFPKDSKFKTPFWERCKCHLYSPTNFSVY